MLVHGPLDSLFLRLGSRCLMGACGKAALGTGCFPWPRLCFLLVFVAELWFSYGCLKKCRTGVKCCSPRLCLAFSCLLLLFFLLLPSLGLSV